MPPGRKPTAAPASKEVAINEAQVRSDMDAITANAVQQQEGALALAHQIGYDGALTVGALEDEIRFYQRRSVEALLECGKRLLLLRELTPHGEFTQRVELLGFHIKSAQRFMAAATKTAKNDKLSLLATQVKSAAAFLELVTHDSDEDIEAVSELDGIDRMSASELRTALREAQAERQADRDVLAKRAARIEKLERDKVLLERQDPDEQLKRLQTEAGDLVAEIRALINGALRQAVIAFTDGGSTPTAAGLVGQVHADLVALRDEFMLPDVSGETPEWQKWADAQDAAKAAAAEH